MLDTDKLLELVMIVKDSGEVLRECLKENKKYIDYWTIVDTGSKDNTCKIIEEELKDIPGKLHYAEFIDFSHARNKSLELSSKTCKYTIILDDSYLIMKGEELRNFLSKEESDCIRIKIGKFNGYTLSSDYYSKRIIKSSANLKYKYRVHEDIYIDDFIDIKDPNIFVYDLDSYEHIHRSQNRFKRDINFLLLDLDDYPDNARILYYIATTYMVTDNIEKGIEYYKKAESLDVIHPDYLYSSILNRVSIEYKFVHKDKKTFIDKLLCIIKNKMFSNRYEAQYKLALIYKLENNLLMSEFILDNIISKVKPVVVDIIEDNLYEFFIPSLYIDVKILLGKYDNAIEHLKLLLQKFPTNQQLLNIKYYLNPVDLSSIKLSEYKTIVIHTGDIVECWNPILLNDKRISGSEIMAVNLAKEFTKYNYRVFVFGSFQNKNVNYEGIDNNGVEYIDLEYFTEFALKYVIDYLIVSRHASNLCYYNNIKNVFLWVHDTLPILLEKNSKSFQTHKIKFKKLISVTNWQKNNIIKHCEISDEFIYVSRNAINPDRFNHVAKKVPYRFIYSSCVFRGLDTLIDIFPRIKEKYPESTLHLFVRKEDIDIETMNKIKKMDYVFVNGRVSQEQLAVEFLKSDIFLYPTDFQETYCITALEAMISKCLVVTVDYCGLGEIVKSRGITVPYPIRDNIDELLRKLFFVLDKPNMKNHIIDTAYNWAIKQNYEELANDWIENLF